RPVVLEPPDPSRWVRTSQPPQRKCWRARAGTRYASEVFLQTSRSDAGRVAASPYDRTVAALKMVETSHALSRSVVSRSLISDRLRSDSSDLGRNRSGGQSWPGHETSACRVRLR